MKQLILFALMAASLQGCVPDNNASNTAADEKPLAAPSARAAIPEGSIFNMADTFITQHNAPMQLSSLQGKPTLIAMIFTHCGYACPRLTADMKGIHDKLGAKAGDVHFVLVSFDVERDTPEQLAQYAKQMELTPDWVLLHGGEETVRALSVLLNIQFEKDAEGNFSHSNVVSVLDKNGVLAFQKEGLEADHAETIANIEKLAK